MCVCVYLAAANLVIADFHQMKRAAADTLCIMGAESS